MGQVDGERGGGLADRKGGGGVVSGLKQLWRRPLPVCGRYDYSAWLLICISFGAPWLHHTLSVCSPRSWRHTLSNTLNINTLTLYFPSFSLTQSFTHIHSASVFIALGTREWYASNGKWQILFHILCKGNMALHSHDTFDIQPLQISHEAASVEWIDIPIICMI